MAEDLAEVTSIHYKETMDNKIQVIRDDIAETKKMCRKMYFEQLPAITGKVDNVTAKLDAIEIKINQLLNK